MNLGWEFAETKNIDLLNCAALNKEQGWSVQFSATHSSVAYRPKLIKIQVLVRSEMYN